MKKLLSRILVVMMVLATMIPAVSFAEVGDPPAGDPPAGDPPTSIVLDNENANIEKESDQTGIYTEQLTTINDNLWVASDDKADIYINGNFEAHNTTYSTVTKYYITNITNHNFVAVKAEDSTGTANIAGFKLVLKNNNNSYLYTNKDWYVYIKNTEPPKSGPNNTIEWFKEDYTAVAGDWVPVTNFLVNEPHGSYQWAPDSLFPEIVGSNNVTLAKWIWSFNYNYDGITPHKDIDTPIYLRSCKPGTPTPPVTYYTVTYSPGTQPSAFIETSTGGLTLGAITPGAPTFTNPSGYTFTGWSPVPTATVGGIATYTALWSKNETPITTYTVTYSPGSQPSAFTETSTGGLTLGAITPGAPTITTPSGYTFNGWSPVPTATVAGIATYTAQWIANVVTPDPTPQPNPNPRPNRPTSTPVVPEVTIPDVQAPTTEAPVIIEEQPTATAEDPNVPQTSDSNNIFLLLGLLFGSGAGIAVLGRRKVNAGK